MPPKEQRTKRAPASASQPVSAPSISGNVQPAVSGSDNYQNMSAMELIRSIMEVNKDPAIENMLIALSEKIPKEFSEVLEKDKREHTIFISGIEEAPGDIRPSQRQKDFEDKVCGVLDALDVECHPVEIYRMGKLSPDRPRLMKVVLPTRSHWRRALANARFLRNAGLANVFIRRSMTVEERKQEYELRQEARERNKGKDVREWVVYQGQLKRTSELPYKRPGNL